MLAVLYPTSSILIVHLLPTQSNDEVSEVFVRVRGVEDDPLYYSLERWTVLLAESASDGIQLYSVCLRAGYPKIVIVFVSFCFLINLESFTVLFI